MSNLLLPFSISLGLLMWSLVAKWYILPWMCERSLSQALTPLLLFNVLRYVGLAFLIPGVTAEPLDPRFANPAAWGDFAAALLALFALWALRQNWRHAGTIVWVFNLFGALDLLTAVSLGLRFTVDGHLGAAYFIPAMLVPAYLVAHATILIVQLRAASLSISVDEPIRTRRIS